MKFIGTIISLLICYIIYFDLTEGTLPKNVTKLESIYVTSSIKLPYFEETVHSGDTVLTIVENKLKAQIPVSINEVINDFEELNNGISPEKIQSGNTYRFPDYAKQ